MLEILQRSRIQLRSPRSKPCYGFRKYAGERQAPARLPCRDKGAAGGGRFKCTGALGRSSSTQLAQESSGVRAQATEFPAAGAAIPFVVLRTAPLSSLVLSLASATELTAEILILCQVRLNSLRRSGDTPRSKGALDQYHAIDVCLVC